MTSRKALFSPFRIGRLELPNRIVMPPMATYFAGTDGSVNDRHIAYYVKRARGGVGYITFEHTAVLPQGRTFQHMALLDSDRQTPSFCRLTESIHQAGGRIVIQINHAGRQSSSEVIGGPIVAPSAIRCPSRKETPRALSPMEIQEIIAAFGRAAGRVQAAGADGVEIHMAHGYLLNQFLSPFSNQREDDYGGTAEKRMKVPLAVLQAVRSTVGSSFPVICRISADEYVEGGLRIEHSREIARALERNGADALHVSAAVGASGYLNHPPYYAPEGVFAHLAQAIKETAQIPIIAVGRIRTPELANRIIEEKKADLVAMGRALIADPDLPQKALRGAEEEIIPCISCNRCTQIIRQGGLRCSVNPETGMEEANRLERTAHPKKVWVIGGGPAGMKAAETAARRGHRVALFERGNEMGGQFLLAAIPPGKEVLKEFLTYQTRKLGRLPIEIFVGTPFDPSLLLEEAPDIAVLATGAEPTLPPIEGIMAATTFTVEQSLREPASLGEKVLVIGGGGVGAEVADFLADKGKEVTLLEMREAIAMDLPPHMRHFLEERLSRNKVRILTSTMAVRFAGDVLHMKTPRGLDKISGFDCAVLATGMRPRKELLPFLQEKVPGISIAGDASQPGELMEALHTGHEIGLKI